MSSAVINHFLSNLPEVKIFDLQLVDGHCITPFDIYHVTPTGKESYVRAVAFAGTEREHSILIDKADIIEDIRTNKVSGSVWIDLTMDAPTTISQALGLAIESKCREYADSQV